jgi:hypothetical protein
MVGYPGGVFKPQEQIPRVQVLVSLANGLSLSSNNANALSVYKDASQIPNYASGPVAAATQRQLVVNYPTPSQLNPNRVATRADVAAFVYQALVNAGRKSNPVSLSGKASRIREQGRKCLAFCFVTNICSCSPAIFYPLLFSCSQRKRKTIRVITPLKGKVR